MNSGWLVSDAWNLSATDWKYWTLPCARKPRFARSCVYTKEYRIITQDDWNLCGRVHTEMFIWASIGYSWKEISAILCELSDLPSLFWMKKSRLRSSACWNFYRVCWRPQIFSCLLRWAKKCFNQFQGFNINFMLIEELRQAANNCFGYHHQLNVHFLPRLNKGMDGCFPTALGRQSTFSNILGPLI